MDRIVPNQVNEDKLLVKVEPFYEWVVDESQIKGENPPIKGILFVEDLQPYIERKLYTVNTGHSIVAYLGYLAGIHTIHESFANEEIESIDRKSFTRNREDCSLQNMNLMSKYMMTIFKKLSVVLPIHL